MTLAKELLSGVEHCDRRLEVGDRIEHASLGTGKLLTGWDGYLKVEFRSGTEVFTNGSEERLIPTPRPGEWRLTNRPEAEAVLAEYARQRRDALHAIRASFATNFLEADARFRDSAAHLVDRKQYEQEKTQYVHAWMEKFLRKSLGDNFVPDDEQAVAIGSVEGHVQLIARAGSGKTETLSSRAVFLQRQCGVSPEEMLLLAFNRDAVSKLEEQLRKKLDGAPPPHVMTFHALAYAIVPGAKSLLANSSDGVDQSLNAELQRVLWDAMERGEVEARVKRLMLAHFRADWESILGKGLNLDRDSMLEFRRGLASETLRGEYVKSYGEKVIANFLFEHGIPYEYERSHRANGRNYRPDFTLPKSDRMPKPVVIEYFGMQGNLDYDRDSAVKRSYWLSKADRWTFIELSPDHWDGDRDRLERELTARLTDAGIRLRRLSEDEIWDLARSHSILCFTKAVSGFVGRCRKQWCEPDDLRELIAGHPFGSDVERWFVELAAEIYEMYLDRLCHIGKDDFDGLMQRAATLVSKGVTAFSRKSGGGNLKRIRYLLIDEYQDFSELFHRLVDAMLKANPRMRVFCVGDDWQAINRFAGSDIRFYHGFRDYFKPAIQLELTTNRRSTRKVVDIGNALMRDRGSPARYSKRDNGIVRVVDLARFRPTSLEERLFRSSSMTPVVLRLAAAELAKSRKVVLLSATNDLIDPAGGRVSLDRYLKALRARLPDGLGHLLTVSTTHTFKGDASDSVIVLDAFERSYPLIHPNWVFTRVLGETEREIIDESRRLFYVALTRARENLFIITESGRKSPFLGEIAKCVPLPEIDWKDYPLKLHENDWMVVKVSGDFEAIRPLIPMLKADGYAFRDLHRAGGSRTWDKPFRRARVSAEILSSPWALAANDAKASNVRFSVYDMMETSLLECEYFEGELRMHLNGTSVPVSLELLERILSGDAGSP